MHADMLALMHETLDGTAHPAQAARLSAHLGACAECAAAWRALSAVHHVMLTAETVAPAPGLTRRVMARIESERAVKPARARPMQLVAAAAVAALVLGITALQVWPNVDAGDVVATMPTFLVTLVQTVSTWLFLIGTIARTLLAVGGATAVDVVLAATLVLVGAWAWLMAGASRTRPLSLGGLQ